MDMETSMIKEFLSQPLNLNLLTILIVYLICILSYSGVDTAVEVLLLLLLLCVNNVLFFIRGMAHIIFTQEIDRDDT